MLAEFLVAKALKLDIGIRDEWDKYDLETKNGWTIEVKSAAYLQSWHQEKLSPITFGIAPTQGWNPDTGEFDPDTKRQANLYIFCLLATQDQSKLDPMNLDQWIFYALPTSELNEHMPTQKTISLSSLLKLNPAECRFGKLKWAVAEIINRLKRGSPISVARQ